MGSGAFGEDRSFGGPFPDKPGQFIDELDILQQNGTVLTGR